MSDTPLIGIIDMMIQEIREKAATRVNFVAPGPPVRPSPEQKEAMPFLKTGPGPDNAATVPRENPSPAALLFVPLPITTPLYPNSRFFLAREDGGKAGSGDPTASCHLVIAIDTENLGQLWFNIAAEDDCLHIKCFTEKEEVSRRIRTGFPDLRSALSDLAFTRIDLLSLTSPVLDQLERPGTPDTDGGSLIDVEV